METEKFLRDKLNIPEFVYNSDELSFRLVDIMDTMDAFSKHQNQKLIEALKGISRIKDLLCYPLDVPFEHISEAEAVSEALSKVESLLNETENGN